MRDGEGHIKIGMTEKLPQRLQSLEYQCGKKLEPYYVIFVPTRYEAAKLEEDLHQKFKEYNYHHEWFYEKPIIEWLMTKEKSMEEYHQITLDEWTQWKEDIRNKLAETAQNFVYIGYRLKQIRDSGMFGGAADVFEFAQNEYGLGKSTVSRFIAINEKYSKEGNSLELKDEYKGFSSSKLSEMLTLPDSECELITEKTTVKDIRELKNFDKQPMPEAMEPIGEHPLKAVIIDYFKDKKDMLNEVLELYYHHNVKEAAECMNPSGIGTHSKGICFLFMYEFENGIKYKLLMDPEPKAMDWADFLEKVMLVYEYEFDRGAYDVWSQYYENKDVIAEAQHEEAQEPQQPEPIAENENAASEPPVEEEKTEEPVNNIVEANSEKSENEEAPINAEEEEPKKAGSQETTCTEPCAISYENEIKNDAAFRNAKETLNRLNQTFKEGNYTRVLEMADVFIMHLERAIR